LAELLIGMAMTILVVAGCFAVLGLVQSAAGAEQKRIAQQQDLRIGLEVFGQEVRLATADSFITATTDVVEFLANVHGKQTSITAPLTAGQSDLPVRDGSDWAEGKNVEICGVSVCEARRLSRPGQQSLLTLDSPVGLSFPAGASVAMRNRVVYYIKQEEEGNSLMRMVDGGAAVLIGDLKTVTFSYRDRRGHITWTPSEIAKVVVEIGSKHTRGTYKRGVALRS
jgi:hypothetical protein